MGNQGNHRVVDYFHLLILEILKEIGIESDVF